jgi:uncharacterized MAPEG superfamily protein
MYVIVAAIVLLVAGLLLLAFLLARGLKAVRVGRRRRVVGARLAAVAERAGEADRQRREAADVGAALTALLPAIQPAKQGPRRVA